MMKNTLIAIGVVGVTAQAIVSAINWRLTAIEAGSSGLGSGDEVYRSERSQTRLEVMIA